MIFVTVGASPIPFDRLIAAVDDLDDDDVVVQYGSAKVRPRRGRSVSFMAFDDVVAHLRDADVVVAHAGAGSVMAALAAGRTPVVVPRLQRLGEAIDDHQLGFARRLDRRKVVRLVEDVADLPRAVQDARAASATSARVGSGPLASEIRGFLEERVRAAAAGPRR
jgi:UDP-N-acetylglucosamine transferase subunit ALG13